MIFVPTITSPAKTARIQEYGADIVIVGDRYADALAASAEQFTEETGATPVYAFDQIETLLGQGTAKEIEADTSAIDTLFVAVGGGGLIGGIASWFAGKNQDRRGRI